MCGRYASTASPDELMSEFEVDDLFEGLPGADYNVAPTVAVPAVFERRVRDTGEVRRRLAPLVWGLVPSWAKDTSIGSRLINARLETVAEKPAFRKAFSQRRCLLPADGFYEWYAPDGAVLPPGGTTPPRPPDGGLLTPGGTIPPRPPDGAVLTPGGTTPLRPPDGALTRGRSTRIKKQPFFIHRADSGRLVMAGIYEIWRDPSKDRDDDSAWLRTCSVITTEATDAVGHIHDRMPMVISREAIDAWLDPALTDPQEALKLLAVTEAAQLEAYAVSTDVNSVQNNDPSLIDPIGDEPQDSAAEPQDTLI